MLEHCDFAEQVTAATDEQVVRPDLVVRLHGGRSVVVDAKAPFDAYLSAMEARDERGRDTHLDAHARHLRGARRRAGRQVLLVGVRPTPEFVVLFVPADPFLDAALAARPDAAGARVHPQRGARHPGHAGRAAAHGRLRLAAGGAGPQRGRGAHPRPGALRAAVHDGRPRRQARRRRWAARSPRTTGRSARWRPGCWSAPASSPSWASRTTSWPRPPRSSWRPAQPQAPELVDPADEVSAR